MNDKQLQAAIDKQAKYRSEEVQEMLEDIGHKMARDQEEWLDKVMKDILPPNLYQAGLVGDMDEEIHEYLTKHGFQVVWIPDSLSIRITRMGNVHAEFNTSLTVDGDPIESSPTGPLQNN